MITPESAPKHLASLMDSIKHNAACYDRVAERAKAYKGASGTVSALSRQPSR